jgi:hypothetical protein
MDFQNLVGDLASIRASTKVPSLGLTALPTAPEPSSTPPRSPIRQHPHFLPSPNPYQSPFQPQASSPPDRPIEFRLLQNFIENLPVDKPSPFATDVFVESPSVKQKLVQKPIVYNEYDEEGGVIRWVEMGLALEDPPQHRMHCVMAGTSKVAVRNSEGQHYVDGDCAVWTRKYPAGWKGLYRNEAGELVEVEKIKTGPNTVWCFSAAAILLLDGFETRIECVVPKNLIDIAGVQYEVEPGWKDVVRCLKKEILVWPRPKIEEPPIAENTSSPKESPRRSRKAPKKGKMTQPGPDTLQSLPSQASQPPARPSPYELSPLRSQTSAQQTMEQASTHVISSVTEKGKGVVYLNQFNKNAVPHSPFNQLYQGHHTFGMNQTPPSSSHEVLASPSDIGNHGVEESNHDEMQEMVLTVPSTEAASHAHPQQHNVPSQVNDPFYKISSDQSNIHAQVVTHVPDSQSTVAAIVPGENQGPLPAQEQPKPKRKRAPSKNKQAQSMQDVPEQSVQTGEAAEVATPPSAAKRGRKRKESTGSTPARKNTPGSKTPAKRRASAKATVPAELSEDREDDEQGESTVATMATTQFGPSLASTQQFGQNFASTHQNRAYMPPGNNQTRPMTNPMPPAGNLAAYHYVPSLQPSMNQRLLSLFDEQRELWLIINQPGRVNGDPSILQRVQERLRQLDVERNYLLACLGQNVPGGAEH